MLEEYIPFIGLIIFGNIENLILASQGVVQGVNPKILGGLSIIAVIIWLIIGTVATEVAIQYSSYITYWRISNCHIRYSGNTWCCPKY